MATWTSGVNNGYSLRMNAYEIGVNQAANSSTVRIDLWLKVGTTPSNMFSRLLH